MVARHVAVVKAFGVAVRRPRNLDAICTRSSAPEIEALNRWNVLR